MAFDLDTVGALRAFETTPAASRRLAVDRARRLLAMHGLEATIHRPVPQFRPGDVLVVRFTTGGSPYTYVRGLLDWPGDRRHSKTDADMAQLFRDGKAELMARDGTALREPLRGGSW